MFYKESMEMPLTTKNLVHVISNYVPHVKKAMYMCMYVHRGVRATRNLGYESHEGLSGD